MQNREFWMIMTQRNFIRTYKLNPVSVGNMISKNRKSKGWILQQS